LHERWRVPNARRDMMTERAYQILDDSKAKPRDVISAFNAILSACKRNLQTVSTVIKAQEHEGMETRMVEIERRLGIVDESGGPADPANGGSAE